MVIQDLTPDGPAARTGLKKEEVITAVAGQPIRLPTTSCGGSGNAPPGQTIDLTVLSPDGTGTRQVAVPIGCLEVGWPHDAAP